MSGRTTALYGLSGSGKTTQLGEYAKYIKRKTGLKTLLNAADMGGFDSILPLVEAGLIDTNIYSEADDPWSWLNDAVSGPIDPQYGLSAFDSATSMGEAFLSYCAKAAAQGTQIGQQKIYKLSIPTSDGKSITLGGNNESQYGLIQTFMLDMIWKSTWISRKQGIDILWTFGEHHAENANEARIVGPKLVGKALTGLLPKWLQYTLRLVELTDAGQASRHLLFTQAQPELNGMGMCYANSRYPMDATTPLPPIIEPASLPVFWELIDQAHQEAKDSLSAEFGS